MSDDSPGQSGADTHANGGVETDRRNLLQALGAGSLVAAELSGVSAAQETSERSPDKETSGGDLVWAFDEPSGEVFSSPTVVNGTVYVGSWDSNLYAVDAATGSQEWAFTQSSSGVSSSPTVVEGTVYVGSYDSTLYAVDAATGSQEWAFTQPSNAVDSSPTVADGTLYVGSRDSTLYAVDAATGSQEWAFTQPSNDVDSSPTVVDGTVYVGSYDSTLYAVDANSGEQEWAFTQPSNDVDSSPTVVDGTVYVGSWDSNLYAVDAATGSQEWAFTQPSGGVDSSPTVADGTLYVGSSEYDGEQFSGALYAVDAATGTQEWAFTQPSNYVESSPTVADGTVYVGAAYPDDTLYAVDAAMGTQEWAFTQPDDVVTSSPTVVDGTVYVGSWDSTLYAVDAGVEGHSEGSRVNLGTLGHHGAWADQPPQADLVVDATAGEDDPEYQTIQAAVADAEEGDVIEVLAGTYEGPVVLDKTVTIRTSEDAVVETGLTGGDTPLPVCFDIDDSAPTDIAPTLRGFTLAGGGDTSVGVRFGGIEGDWTVEDLTVDGDLSTVVYAYQTGGNWTVSGLGVSDTAAPDTIVNARESTGEWTVADSTLAGSEPVNAEESTGGWHIENCTVTGGDPFPAIDARQATGDWHIERTDIETSGTAIRADETLGDWRVTGPADITGADVGVNANDSEGAWKVHRTNFLEMTGDGTFHILANAVTNPPGNARRNFFEDTDPLVGGTGDEVDVLIGNQLAAPASDDATGIEITVEDAIETPENPSGVPFPLDGATVYLYDPDESASPELDKRVSVIQNNDIGRLFDGLITSGADRDATTGPDGIVRYNGLDAAEDYYIIIDPPARNSGNVSALEFTATDGTVVDEGVTLTDETFLEYLDADPASDAPELGHYPVLSTLETASSEIIDSRISDIYDANDRTSALSQWNNNPSDEDQTFALLLSGSVAEILAEVAESRPERLAKLVDEGKPGPFDALSAFVEVVDVALAAHMIGWSIGKPSESGDRYEAIGEEFNKGWFNSPHTSNPKEENKEIGNLPTVQTAQTQTGAAQSTLEQLTDQQPPEGFNHRHVREVIKDVTDGFSSEFSRSVLPNGQVLNVSKGKQHYPTLNRAADRLEANEDPGLLSIGLGILGIGLGVAGTIISGGLLGVAVAAAGYGLSVISLGNTTYDALENISNRELFAVQFAKLHYDSVHDIENIQIINQKLSNWLEEQFESPITGTVAGQAEFVGNIEPLTPDSAEQTDGTVTTADVDTIEPAFPPPEPTRPLESEPRRTIARGKIELSYQNTGDVGLPYRVLGYTRYSTDVDEQRDAIGPVRTTYPDITEPEPGTLEPNTQQSATLGYVFPLPKEEPFRAYTAHAVLTLGGERVDDVIYDNPIEIVRDAEQGDEESPGQAATGPERVPGYSSSTTQMGQPISKSEFDGYQPDVSTVINTELTPGEQSTMTFTGADNTAELTLLLFTTDNQDVDMFLENEAGDTVGSVPGESEPVTEITDSEYTELVDGARITLLSVSPETYSLTVACSPLAPEPASVTTLAVETPDRPAVLGTVPTQFRILVQPGKVSKTPLTLTEVGNQEPVQGVSFETAPLTNSAGTALPEETLSIENEQTEIPPSEQTDATVLTAPPESVDLSDEPTRFSGEITVSSETAGSLSVPVSTLLLDTSLGSVQLLSADGSVTAVRLFEGEIPDESPAPAGNVQSVYDVTIDGEGPVTLTLPTASDETSFNGFRLVDGEYEAIELFRRDDSVSVTLPAGSYLLVVAVGPRSLPGYDNPPRDLDGDGRFEDIDGNGSFDIFDVQALFNGLESDPVQNNPEAFNFNDDDNPDDVSIFDVQRLFELLE
jgi:outer membrane protein assembly factor BamB